MSALAIDGAGAAIGLTAQRMWVREARLQRKAKGTPALGGENLHWLEALESNRRAFADIEGATPWYQLDRGADC